MKIPRALAWMAFVWTAAFWFGGIGIPLVALLSRVAGWQSLFDPVVLSIARVTAAQAFWSTFFSILIGLPLGLVVGGALVGRRWVGLSEFFLALPFGVPSVIAGFAWVAWLGRSGIIASWGANWGWSLDWSYSLAAVILAHVFFNAPWVALLIAQARRQIPRDQLESATTLGSAFFSRFRWILWPRIRWALAAAAVQVFSFCTMSFALVLILGGGPPVQTLETALYSRMRYGSVNLSGAIACACWELVITLTPWLCLLTLRARSQPGIPQGAVPKTRFRRTGWLPLVVVPICASFCLPYLAVFSGRWWEPLFLPEVNAQVVDALGLSLRIAGLTSFGTLLTAAAALLTLGSMQGKAPIRRAALGALLGLPSGLSVLVLGLGVWLAYDRWLDPFSGSLWPMLLLQIALFFPFAFRSLWPLSEGIQVQLLEAAATQGATPVRGFWLVEWPRWKGPVLGVLAMVAGASLGEVAAVSLFASERLIPLPFLISQWMSQYRFEEARAISALLLLLSVLAVLGTQLGNWRRDFAASDR